MTEIKIGKMIKVLRTEKEISQETLADRCNVSMQAVSKWENEQSYPDITLLPVIADYFQVTADYLLTGNQKRTDGESGISDASIEDMLKQDTERDTLYIVQYQNGRIIDKKSFYEGLEGQEPIKVIFEKEFTDMRGELRVEIWGNAEISGDIMGSVSAGGAVECAEVNGCVDAGGTVNCAEVNGAVSAGGAVSCSDVSGDVSAGAEVNCGDVGGDVTAGCEVKCGDIGGNASAGVKVICTSMDKKSDNHTEY